MEPEILCNCKGLAKSYGRREVLTDCTLTVGKGELIGLVGENGSGKSTLIRCLLGFTRPSGGTAAITGRVGYCPQEAYLNDSYTVGEHLSLAGSIYSRHAPVDPSFADRHLRRLGLDEYGDYLIRDLSEGTRQKLKFLTSILHQPTLLLMDEPYGGFDWNMYLVFWETVKGLCEEGTGVLLISHLIFDRQIFDRVYDLRGGRLDVSG